MSLLEVHQYNLDGIEEAIDGLPETFAAVLAAAAADNRQKFLINMVELSATLNDMKSTLDEIMQHEKS